MSRRNHSYGVTLSTLVVVVIIVVVAQADVESVFVVVVDSTATCRKNPNLWRSTVPCECLCYCCNNTSEQEPRTARVAKAGIPPMPRSRPIHGPCTPRSQ